MKISGKTKLKYDERLEKTPMMIRKDNVAMRESNDNIDHKNVVIILIFNNTYSMLLLFFYKGLVYIHAKCYSPCAYNS